MRRLLRTESVARRAWAAAVAALAVLAMPAIASAQAAQGPTERDPIGARDLVLDRDTADAPPARPPTVPRGYALVIGVGDYRNLDESQQLPFAESDARAMYRVLISHEGGAFPAENVRVLVGEQASLTNIRRAIEEWLPSVATPDDRVVVYFVGHGFVKDGRGYLAPWDVDPGRLHETAYPMTTLGDVMANRVQAHWKVLLTDACHSGKINAETTNEALDLHWGSLPRNFLTLTAATEREQAYYDSRLETGFGFFTYFLTRALQGYADFDPCDGQITADEVIEYVRSNVRTYARERDRFQTPTARGDFDPRMPLGVSTKCLNVSRAPSLVGAAVVEVNRDDVDLYIDGRFIQRLTRGEPLVLEGLPAGLHEFKGVRRGYEPDIKEAMVAPGQRVTVTLRIRYPRRVSEAVRELVEQGERLLFTRRSAWDLGNLLPVRRSQSRDDLERARDLFIDALDEDPAYGRAARHLGHVQQLLGEYRESEEAYRLALRVHPSDVEAHVHLAGVLLESGDPDEAIRQLTDAERLAEPTDALYARLARAYWDKGAWEQAVGEAGRAIALNESNAQAHLWKADALRQQLAEDDEASPAVRHALFRSSREHYRTFLNLTNFESSFGEKLAFHFIGFGVGRRRHADREDVYREYRKEGYLGLCLTEDKLGHPLRAREYCQRAIRYRENSAIGHFLLGNINRDLYNVHQTCDYLTAAARSYRRMLEINADLAESDNARYYLEQISAIAPQLGCSAAQ